MTVIDRRLGVFVLWAVLSSCQTAPVRPEQAAQEGPLDPMTRIANLEDRRARCDGELAQLAQEASPALRVRALLAMARLESERCAPALERGLVDPDARVRATAAFGSGVIAFWHPISPEVRGALTAAVLGAEAKETELAAHREELLALGRLAAPAEKGAEAAAPGLVRLVERLESPDPQLRGIAATALGVAQRAKAKVPSGWVGRAAGLLAAGAPVGTRFGGAYALSTSKLPEARPALLGCLTDLDPEVRSLCVKGLTETATDADLGALSKALADADPRVSVEAVRVLAKQIDKCALVDPCPAIELLLAVQSRVLELEQGHASAGLLPLLALAQAGVGPRAEQLLRTVRSRLAQAPVPAELADDLAKLDCRFAAALDRQQGELREVRQCGLGRVTEAYRIGLGLREVSQSPKLTQGTHPRDLARELGRREPQVRSAAVDVLGSMKPEALAKETLESLREQVRPLIGSDDPILAASAAGAAAVLGDAAALPQIRALAARVPRQVDLAQPVADALAELKDSDSVPLLQGWLRSPETSVREAAAKALTALTGKPVKAPEVERPVAAPLPADRPAKLVLHTAKGDVAVRLDWEQAPRTAGNLVSLARKGYFRGVTFHRIVPDFVVQGGDPRGDGQGGPGYQIRCEVNPRPYVRGTVGMALSGKDTGGSQFFVTTSAQPHLEGRYTIFGEVVAGMEIVDRLLEGDVIEDVEIVQAG